MDTKSTPFQDLTKLYMTEDGEIPFFRDVWGFYKQKGVKTSFVTVNPNQSFRLDLEICENLGCPIQIVTNSDEIVNKWAVVTKTLKARKIDADDSGKEWLEGIQKKWILPKNIVVNKSDFSWQTLKEEVRELAEPRIDLLKIEGTDEQERMLLYSMMESGFRPGAILVKYTEDPDMNVPAMLVAGHLQMIGYRLVEAKNNWFFYIYTDMCLYDSCSWRDTKVQNPLVHYLVELFHVKKETTAEQETAAPAPAPEPSTQ